MKTLTNCAAILGGLFSLSLTTAGELLDRNSATHKPTQSITPMLDGQSLMFHTFALSPERELWLCCSSSEDPKRGKLLIYAVDSKFSRAIDLAFVPTTIGFANHEGRVSSVFVSGSGKIAKLSPMGEVLRTIDAPNIGNREEVLASLREESRKQSAELLASVEKQSLRVKKQVAQLETVPEGETDEQKARRLRRLKLLTQQVKQIQLTLESVASGEAGITESSLANLERSTGLAVTKGYLFVAMPQVGPHGYDVWRLDHQLDGAKKVLQNGSGCCGQYDIQTDGQHLVVADNCNFSVAYYDADGQPVKKFGRQSSTDADGFGSCCNPMNVCCEGDEVLTAESSIGHIKRFSADGKLLAYIGTAPIGGGCKHVAVAHDRVSDRYFMFNQDRKCISVLVPKAEAAAESDEERAARAAMAGLGQKLIGTWKAEAESENALVGFIAKKYGKLSFGSDGDLSKSSLSEAVKTSGDTLDSLAKVAGSVEAARMLANASQQSRWQAIMQKDNQLHVGLYEDGVASFEARVVFEAADRITMSFFYGSTEPVAVVSYRKAD